MEYTLEAPNLHRILHEKNIAQYGGTWVEECEPGNVVKVKLFSLSRDGYKRTSSRGPASLCAEWATKPRSSTPTR